MTGSQINNPIPFSPLIVQLSAFIKLKHSTLLLMLLKKNDPRTNSFLSIKNICTLNDQ